MSTTDDTSLASEREHHRYHGNKIPWYVRALWIGFWIFAVYYAVQYFLPALSSEWPAGS